MLLTFVSGSALEGWYKVGKTHSLRVGLWMKKGRDLLSV